MPLKKSDWAIFREAEKNGLSVALTSIISRERTSQNTQLEEYFRNQYTNYESTFGEEICEEALDILNEVMQVHHIEKAPLQFPITQGSELYLLPITPNLSLSVFIADEYYGDGNYEKYFDMNFFVINEETTEQDVDVLIHFLKEFHQRIEVL